MLLRVPCLALALAASACLAGCNSGLAALLSSSTSEDSSNAGPSVAELALGEARTSPAVVGFTLIDNEGDPASVRIGYSVAGGPVEPIVLAQGDADLSLLSTSSSGTRHERHWDFQSQLGEQYRSDVVLTIEVLGSGVSQSTQVNLGNDAPVISDVEVPAGEVVGVAVIDMLVSDSSSDLTHVSLEYDLVGDEPDLGFRPATPAGGGATELVADPTGSTFTFFWDVLADEGFTENDVNLRLTPNDGTLAGASGEVTIRVDNNSPPIAVLENVAFFTSTDQRDGIPLGFTVFDGDAASGEPGDALQLVFQWRRPSEAFPALPSSPAAIEAILADPALRAEHQIATQKPLVFEGVALHDRTNPADELAVRLPELATTATRLLVRDPDSSAVDLTGELEILRRHDVPLALNAPDSALENPVAALPIPDRLEVMVLEAPAGGGWRLREFDLARKAAVGPTIAGASAGSPTAMAVEGSAGSVLVASDLAGAWLVQRAGPAGVTDLIGADGSTELGSIRGIAALGSEACLITVGDSLIRLSYPPGEAPSATILFSAATKTGPLQTPWGLALDLLDTDRVFVAERGADRVVEIELSTLEKSEVLAPGSGFPAPEHIALERFGDRLLVVTDAATSDGQKELRSLDLGDPTDNDGNGADLEVVELIPGLGQAPALPDAVGGLAVGPGGLRLLTLTSSNDLAVGGGVEQVRQIASYVHATQTVRVDAPFAPAFEAGTPGRPWRIRYLLGSDYTGSPEGSPGIFLWDSRDADDTEVVLRLVPVDSEVGTQSSTGAPREVFPFFGGESVTSGNLTISGFNMAVRAGDLDGDGDLDLMTTNGDDVVAGFAAFFQTNPREFSEGLTVGDPTTVLRTEDLELADLDGDGDLDLVGEHRVETEPGEDVLFTISMFFQESPGTFSDAVVLAQPATGVATGDLDGDGDIDIVVQNRVAPFSIDVHFQESPGTFGTPLALTEYPFPSEPNNSVPVDLGTDDLNGDGQLDIYFGHSGAIVIYLQSAPGQFVLGPLVEPAGGVLAISTHDVDRDGKVDLVAGTNQGFLTILLQTSPGTFEPGQVVIDDALDSTRATALGDLDADGDVDLVAATSGDPNLAVFFQDESGAFTRRTSFHVNSAYLADVVLADVDGDGALDLITADTQAHTVTVHFAGNLPEFVEGETIGNSEVTPTLIDLAQGDLDGDGDLDLVAASQLAGSLTVFHQELPGSYSPGPLLPIVPQTRGVELGDLDRDGDLDVVALTNSGALHVYLQTASDQFEPQPPIDVPWATDARTFHVVDIDGDGALDLVAIVIGPDGSKKGLDENSIAVLLQSADGQFGPAIQVGDGDTVSSPNLEIADFDTDGDLDLVVGHIGLNTVNVFAQTDPGVFTLDAVVTEQRGATGTISGFVADMDGNGTADVVLMGNTLSVAYRTLSGDLLPEIVFGTTLFTHTNLEILDVDRDGKLDVAVTRFDPFQGSGVLVFTQNRPDAFTAGPALGDDLGNIFPTFGLLRDFDSDGDLDVGVNHLVEGFVQLYLGSH